MRQNSTIDRSSAADLRIGSKVRELREKRRYTLQDLATKSGLSKTLLADIESGDVIPPRGDTAETGQIPRRRHGLLL